MVLKRASLTELLGQTFLRAGVEQQQKRGEAVPREEKDHGSKAGVLPGLEELLCLPCRCF